MKTWIQMFVVSLMLSGGTPVKADVARCNDQQSASCPALRDAAVRQGCITSVEAVVLAASSQILMCAGAIRVGQCKCGCFAPETSNRRRVDRKEPELRCAANHCGHRRCRVAFRLAYRPSLPPSFYR